MKRELRTAIVMLLLITLFHGSTGALFAAGREGDDLQKLIRKRFDADRNGSLQGEEKVKAVEFLKKADKNGDGQISAAEQKAIIGLAKKMPSPKMVVRASGKEQMANAAKLKFEQEKIRARLEYQKKIKKEDKPAAKIGSKRKGFYEGSVIIAVAKDAVHTVVPQGALLSLPTEMEGMVVKKPVGKLISWPEFLGRYRRMIATREVSWETAKGEDPIKEGEKKAFAVGGKIVVAVFKKNPITVLEPPPEEEEAVEGAVASDKGDKK